MVVSQQRGRGCITTASPPEAGAATYALAVPERTTLLGLPRISVDYTATAPDFELNSRLWDIAPDGTRTMVSRGAYRGGPALSGKLAYEMFGNAWRVAPGHKLQLELLQDDSTYLRADNVPSTLTLEKVGLELPVH